MASDVIDIRERIERVREAVENSAVPATTALAEAQAAASNSDIVREPAAPASKADDHPVRASKKAAPQRETDDPAASARSEPAPELMADEGIQALQLEQMVSKGSSPAQAAAQLADQAPSIKLNIRSQRINKLLMVMLAVQIASNLALIYLVYQLQV
jgi:hypothetical protein